MKLPGAQTRARGNAVSNGRRKRTSLRRLPAPDTAPTDTPQTGPRFDILSALSPEVALTILRFAACAGTPIKEAVPGSSCHATLYAVQRTCRAWRKVCLDSKLWHDGCKAAGYVPQEAMMNEPADVVLTQAPIYGMRGGKGIKRDFSYLSEGQPSSSRMAKRLRPAAGTDGDWRRYFVERYSLETNWSRGRYIQRSSMGHTDVILSVHVWGDRVVSGCRHGWVKCFDAASGEDLWSQKLHTAGVSCLGTEGDLLLTGSWDCTIKVWEGPDAPKIKFPLATLIHAHPTICMRANKSKIASGTVEGTVYLWCTSGKLLNIFNPNPVVPEITGCIDFDSNFVYSGEHNKINVWNRKTGELDQKIEAHDKVVTALRVDRGRMVSGSEDRTVRVWDVSEVNDGKIQMIGQLEGHTDGVRCLQTFGDKVVSGSYDKASEGVTIRIWSLRSMQHLTTLEGHGGDVNAVDCSARLIVSGSDDQEVKVWDFSPYLVKDVGALKRGRGGKLSWADMAEYVLTRTGRKMTCDEIWADIKRLGLHSPE
ncbi:hypothetical protein HK104_010195 [Borealophlyctis nickersoniae]|nr:hypothetical protein HK104_010195 [Borealophlyctis nickersoniae]